MLLFFEEQHHRKLALPVLLEDHTKNANTG